MSTSGLGVMINQLFGERGAECVVAAIGKEIERAWLEDDALRLRFTDGTGIILWDAGQSCCESRYMVIDDDLDYHAGATLQGIEIRDGGGTEDESGYGECHDIEFLDVKTSRGVIQAASHNEHNGCYGGFWLRAEAL